VRRGLYLPNAETKTAHKCDLCKDSDRIACVDACPTNALTFRESKELVSSRRRERARAVM
jgi:Fe-S-cluster-containing hydrogenase component 2